MPEAKIGPHRKQLQTLVSVGSDYKIAQCAGSATESCPRAAWIPQTIRAVSLGKAGKTASPRQMANRMTYVQSEPVRKSIRFWNRATNRAEPA